MRADVPWTSSNTGIRLTVRVTPKASRTGIIGVGALADGRAALQVRVAAPPVEGAANEALVAYLSKLLGARKADVSIASGDTGRLKQVEIRGEPEALIVRLEAAVRQG